MQTGYIPDNDSQTRGIAEVGDQVDVDAVADKDLVDCVKDEHSGDLGKKMSVRKEGARMGEATSAKESKYQRDGIVDPDKKRYSDERGKECRRTSKRSGQRSL